MKRKCLNCSHCFVDGDGDPVSCDYGLPDGAMRIGDIHTSNIPAQKKSSTGGR